MLKKRIIILLVIVMMLSLCCSTALAAKRASVDLSYGAYQASGTNKYTFWAELKSSLPEDLDITVTVYRLSGSSRIRVGSDTDSDTNATRVRATTTITIVPGSTYILEASGSGDTTSVSDTRYYYL